MRLDLELRLVGINGTQFTDGVQVRELTLQLHGDKLDGSGTERQTQRHFVVAAGHGVQHVGNGTGFKAYSGLKSLLNEGLELTSGHVGGSVRLVGLCALLAGGFKVGLDGAGLDDAEVDWVC